MFLWAWGCGGNGASAVGIGGDTGSGGSGASGSASALPCDVADIVKAKCQNCHGAKPLYGAPMSLMTPADFAAPAKSNPSKTVADLVGSRIHDFMKPMPPPPTGPLDTSSIDTLDAWLAAGAPSAKDYSCNSTSSSSSGGSSSGGVMLSCTPDMQIRAKSAFVMPKDVPDEYICAGADVTVAEKRQIIGVRTAVDNATILHHILLFEVDSSYDPNPAPCGAGGPPNGRLVAAWAPGGNDLELPPEAGFPLEGTKHYVIQMHYSNLMQLEGQADLSGFDVCTTTNLRPNEADIMAFGSVKFDIPAHTELDLTCDLTVPSAIPQLKVFYAMPHLHLLGKIISGEVQHAGGGIVKLSQRNPWTFDDQYWDAVDTTIGPGDLVRTRCMWQNSTPQNVGFGEQTSDEMCFVFVAYYPRIVLPAWNWAAPAASSQCINTP